MTVETIILGAGMCGLGAAASSQSAVYEAAARPGGVCHSIYRTIDGDARDPLVDDLADCFRFEPAGGHWLFGASQTSLQRFTRFCTFSTHMRKAAAFFARSERYVPFPVQNNLRYFDADVRDRALAEIESAEPEHAEGAASFEAWLRANFGPTLCDLFFFPFNDRYTSGYFRAIAPQDLYKSAIDRERVRQGTFGSVEDAGYNMAFHYPEGGLDRLVRGLASTCRIHFGHEVTHIDTSGRIVTFTNGVRVPYHRIVSSIPLDRMVRICELRVNAPRDPATAVLVVNIGALKGPRCPPYHWVYVPDAESGLHRVGIYSNVDRSFLPASPDRRDELVSIYAERSYPTGAAPGAAALAQAVRAIVAELQQWQFIRDALVVEPTFTDPAYTWKWPRSPWVAEATMLLDSCGIRQVGRYGAWRFQGMMASFEEGLAAGAMRGA